MLNKILSSEFAMTMTLLLMLTFFACAIALQELIGLCYKYSVDIDINFNATKSYCVAFTPKLYS